MKLLIYPLIILALVLPQDKNHETNQESGLMGTWELENFYYYDDNEVSDTIPTTDGYRQVKIYTKDRVMWTRSVPRDSTEWFGYGRYIASDSLLVETLEYGSESMMRIIDTMRVFTFELILDENRYSQITLDADGKRFSSENYVRVE